MSRRPPASTLCASSAASLTRKYRTVRGHTLTVIFTAPHPNPAAHLAGEGLFCGISERFITPNLIDPNLNMEYVTYTPLPSLFSSAMRARATRCMPGSEVVILLLSGALNPPHRGHIGALQHAWRHLEARGVRVLGGLLTPPSDMYILHKQSKSRDDDVLTLTAAERLHLARAAVSEHPGLDVCAWESEQIAASWPGGPGYPEVFDVVQNVSAQAQTTFEHLAIRVLYVCGGDLPDRQFMQRLVKEKQASLCVITRCNDGELPKTPAGRELATADGNFLLPAVPDAGTFSSTAVRVALAARDYAGARRMLGNSVFSCMARMGLTEDHW